MGLLDQNYGIDQEELKQMMAQFGPTAEDLTNKRKQEAFALGFGLLQGRKGNELATIGQAGLGAMGAGQQSLMQSQHMRQQSLAAAMQALKTGKELQFQKMLGAELGGGSPGPATVPGPSAGAPPMSAGFGSSSVSQPGTPAPSSAPPDLPRWANPRVEMLAAVGGHKDVADVIHRQLQLTQGPSGTLMRNGQVVGQVIPNVGMVVDGKLMKLPQEATDALVNFEGAKAGATKAAELPYQLDTAISPTGATQRGYVPNLYGQPPVPGRATSPPQFNLQNQSPEGRAAMLRDIANPQPEPNGVVTGPDPIQQKVKEQVGSGAITQLDKSYEPASSAATQTIPLLHEARAMLDSGKVMTGKGADFRTQVGGWLSSAGFKQADDPVANTQAFAATQARQVLSIIKTLGSGSGISDADRDYASKIVGGDVTLNEGALRRLIDISEQAQRASIRAHNKRVDNASSIYKNTGVGELYGVQEPAAYVHPQTATTMAPKVVRFQDLRTQ